MSFLYNQSRYANITSSKSINTKRTAHTHTRSLQTAKQHSFYSIGKPYTAAQHSSIFTTKAESCPLEKFDILCPFTLKVAHNSVHVNAPVTHFCPSSPSIVTRAFKTNSSRINRRIQAIALWRHCHIVYMYSRHWHAVCMYSRHWHAVCMYSRHWHAVYMYSLKPSFIIYYNHTSLYNV